MAITFVNETEGAVAAGTGTENINLPADLAENDLVLVVLCCDDNLVTYDDGIASGQDYVTIDKTSSAIPGREVAYKIMGSTPDSTVTINQNASKKIAYLIQAFRGVDTTTPEDQTYEAATGSGSNPDPPAITTQTDGALVIAVALMDDDDATVTTYPTGYTNTADSDTGQASNTVGASIGIASKTIASAGEEDPSAFFLFDGYDSWVALSIALKPAAGGPPPVSQINIGDVWKDIDWANCKINIGDSWKTITAVYINIGDAWKTVYEA